VVEKLPLLALAVASCVVTVYAQERGGAVGSLEHFPLSIRAANAVLAYAGYIIKMLWPLHLAPFYPYPRQMPPAEHVAAAGLLLAGVTALVLWQRRRRPYLLVGWLWYVGTLVPVIGLVQVGLQAMADRYTYVPLIGLFLMVAWGLGEVAALGREWTRVASLAAVLVLVACMACSRVQVGRWRDSESLWTYTLSVTTRNAAAHNNLARVFEEQGKWLEEQGMPRQAMEKYDEALQHYREAYDLEPEFALYRTNLSAAHNNMGIALEEQGKAGEAMKQYRKAIGIDGDDAGAHCNLGKLLARQGDSVEAIAELRTALRLNPCLALAHYNLGGLLAARGELDEAMVHFRALLWLDKGPLTRQLAEQVQHFGAEQRPEFLDELAAACAEVKRYNEAVLIAHKALTLAEARQQTVLAEAIRQRLDTYEHERQSQEK
jgi:tetratricopeptide (TPR) repeat protein